MPQLRIQFVLCLFGLLSASWGFAAPAHPVAIGDSLREALASYASDELNIVSTTRVLPSRLRVTVTPEPTATAIEQVRALLAPHDLTLNFIDARTAVVERRRVGEQAASAPEQTANPAAARAIEEIVVSAPYRIGRKDWDATLLAQEDLLTIPSIGRDVLRSLAILPGNASSGISAKARFRGGDSNEVLYRLDEVPLIEPFHLSAFESLFSAINPHVVDSADVYLSGFPVSLGERMSGVVDLALVEPDAAMDFTLDINAVAAAVSAAGRKDQWRWIASSRLGLFDKVLGALDTDYGEPRFTDQLLHLNWQGQRQALTAGYLRSKDDIRVADPGAGETGNSEQRNQSAWLKWSVAHSDQVSADWRLMWTHIRSARDGALTDPVGTSGTLIDRRRFRSLVLASDWRWRRSDRLQLTAGASLATQRGSFDAARDSRYGVSAALLQGAATIGTNVNLNRSGNASTAYVGASMQLHPRVRINLGLRYDGQDIDPVHVNELSVRARTHIDIRESLSWFIDIGRYTQQQALHEIQSEDGKAELDPPQHSDQVSTGLLWLATPATQLRIEAFYRAIDNPWSRFDNLYNRWVLLPELQGDRYRLNPSRAQTRGGEIALRTDFNNGLHGYLSYSYSDATERVSEQWIDRPWQQRHTLKAGLHWRTEGWRLGAGTVYRTGWPVTDRIEDANVLPQALYASQLPGYFSLDFHLGRRIRSAPGDLELYVDIANLTDRDNIGGYRYASDGSRSSKSLLPLIPVIGLTWRW